MNMKVFISYILTIFLWGSAFPAIRVALESYNSFHLAFLRMFIASLALLVFAFIMKMRIPDKKDIPIILLLGFLGFSVYHTFLNLGERTVDAGTASLLVSTTPILSALLAAVFLKDRFNRYGWVGSSIAFFGVILITLGTGGGFSIEWGVFLILISAFGESFYFVFQSFYLKKYGFLPFTTYTILAGTLFMFPFSGGLWTTIQQASVESTLVVTYLGLFPTLIPYFAIAYVTAKQGASEATSSLYLTPVVAILISWLWLEEIPTLLSIFGGTLALIGVSLTTIHPKKKEKEIFKQRQNYV
ncbi:putative inner membrane transporter YedA [Paraliobacillus sp. PM-2]|uniref:DMT family transporter n=1 Tax=Paraliobacillus sp. PM-2 TaxID=1462524 RepID=UPI00061C65F7|nr:DMT family transporter [Paraliobacillus sp. PM-2]CQR46616.1 putative inner membrane transporter YedA [Paraliobacillus sp. PM-2]